MGNDTNWLVERLYALSTAVAERDCREFTMRVPAEPRRDADLVLSTAASEIERLTTELAAMTVDRDRLQAFKDYVHKRLDEAGVSVDPESPHKPAGCRIGGRLDEVFAERDKLYKDLEEATTLSLSWAEATSAMEAWGVLSRYLEWDSGGLGAAAVETVRRAKDAEAECNRLRTVCEAVEAWDLRWADGLDSNVERIKQLVREALREETT